MSYGQRYELRFVQGGSRRTFGRRLQRTCSPRATNRISGCATFYVSADSTSIGDSPGNTPGRLEYSLIRPARPSAVGKIDRTRGTRKRSDRGPTGETRA